MVYSLAQWFKKPTYKRLVRYKSSSVFFSDQISGLAINKIVSCVYCEMSKCMYCCLQLVSMHQSCGGMSGDGAQSYAATVISAAKVGTAVSSTAGHTPFKSGIGLKLGTHLSNLVLV